MLNCKSLGLPNGQDRILVLSREDYKVWIIDRNFGKECQFTNSVSDNLAVMIPIRITNDIKCNRWTRLGVRITESYEKCNISGEKY